MTISEARSQYNSANRTRQLSSETLYQDKIVISSFQGWVEKRGKREVNEVTELDIRAYVAELNDKGLTKKHKKEIRENSINTYVNTIKRFFKYCQSQGIIIVNPAIDVPELKENALLPSYVPMTQMEKVFDDFETSTTLSVTQMVMFE